MTVLRRLDDAAIVAGILSVAGALYDAYWRRRRDRENDARDRRVHDLESRIAALESNATKETT